MSPFLSRGNGAHPVASGNIATHVGVCVLKLRAQQQELEQHHEYNVLNKNSGDVAELSRWIDEVLRVWVGKIYAPSFQQPAHEQVDEIWIHWKYRSAESDVLRQLRFYRNAINDKVLMSTQGTLASRYHGSEPERACIIRSKKKYPFGILCIAVEGFHS